MDSTDDGFHSGAHDLSGDEENTRKLLKSREQELKAICDQLSLSPSSFGKPTKEKLEKHSKNIMEKGITDVSRAHIMECHAKQVLKQDDLKALESDLSQLQASYAHLMETAQDLNILHKKAIKSLQTETEMNKQKLGQIQPVFSRLDNKADNVSDIDRRTELIRRAVVAVKRLSERKRKVQQEPSKIPFAAGDNVTAELAAKTKELELLNKRLEELGLQ